MISLMQGDCLERMKEIPRHGYGVSDMNVLSLFDGMSCGQIALERAGIDVDSYFASEIDKYAMKVTKANYPNTRHIGGVVDVRGEDLPGIDLLIGGSPCQGFSFAGKQLNFDDPRSKLFFEFVRILKETKPKYFLLENVRMKKEYQDIISEHLGVEPICINSALVSAQNRVRYYWTNIPGIEQPEDKGLLLKDILEGCGQKVGRIVGRKINPKTGKRDDYNPDIKTVQRIEPRLDYKCGCLTTVQKDNVVIVDRDKDFCLDANYYKGGNLKSYFEKHRRQLVFSRDNLCHIGDADIKGNDCIKRVYSPEGKSPCLTTMGGGHREPKINIDSLTWRKLTPLECERLQTVDDGYTDHVSNTQRYRMLGNGWTVDVIAHILRGVDL